MKKIQSKMKALECLQDNISFSRRSRAANSEVSHAILLKFKLNQANMIVLITCKNEKDLIKNEGCRVVQDFPHYKSMGIFFRHSRAANSAVPD